MMHIFWLPRFPATGCHTPCAWLFMLSQLPQKGKRVRRSPGPTALTAKLVLHTASSEIKGWSFLFVGLGCVTVSEGFYWSRAACLCYMTRVRNRISPLIWEMNGSICEGWGLICDIFPARNSDVCFSFMRENRHVLIRIWFSCSVSINNRMDSFLWNSPPKSPSNLYYSIVIADFLTLERSIIQDDAVNQILSTSREPNLKFLL